MSLEWNGSIGAKLAEGLVTAQAEAASVYKGRQSGGDGGGPRYKYASTEDVVVVAKDALKAGKLAVVQLAAARTGTEKISTTYRTGTFQGDELRVDYLLVHESGESVKITTHTPVIPGPGRPWDKAVAAAETYSMGYALRGILLLVRTDEKEEVDARDDSDVGVAVQRRPDTRKPNNQPAAPLLAAKNDGPGSSPVSTRAASNEPSKGGATLPVSTREVVAAVAAALPDGSGEWFDLDKIKAMTKAFAAPEMLGEAVVREMAKGFGEPKKRTPEQWDAFRRALETRWQETLNNATTFRWELYVKELGETVTDDIAKEVSDHEGQPPEDWTAEQLLRALRMAEKRQADVPQ